MPWEQHGGGYRKKDQKQGGFVKNPKQYEKLKEKYGKERAAAITNSQNVHKRDPLTAGQIKSRKKVQSGIAQTTGALGLGSLAAFGASKLPGSKLASKVPKLQKLNRSTGAGKLKPSKQGEAFKTRATNTALGLSTAGAGIGGAGSFNFARYTKSEADKGKRKPVAKNYEPEIRDFPIGGEVGHRLTEEEISKGVGDWKTINQRERTQSRSRKTMRGAATVGSLGAGLATAGLARKGSLKGGIETGKEARKIYGLARSAGGGRGKSSVTAGRYAAHRHAMPDRRVDSMVTGGVGLMAGAAATGAGAKGHHTYQQRKINQRRRSNRQKQLSKSLFDSETSRMKRSEGYKTATDITTGGLMAGAVGAGTAARKKGFLKKVKTGKDAHALKLSGSKQAKAAGALGAGAAAAAAGSRKIKQNRRSSWQSYG